MVTGGNGLLGRHLVTRLQAAGCRGEFRFRASTTFEEGLKRTVGWFFASEHSSVESLS